MLIQNFVDVQIPQRPKKKLLNNWNRDIISSIMISKVLFLFAKPRTFFWFGLSSFTDTIQTFGFYFAYGVCSNCKTQKLRFLRWNISFLASIFDWLVFLKKVPLSIIYHHKSFLFQLPLFYLFGYSDSDFLLVFRDCVVCRHLPLISFSHSFSTSPSVDMLHSGSHGQVLCLANVCITCRFA